MPNLINAIKNRFSKGIIKVPSTNISQSTAESVAARRSANIKNKLAIRNKLKSQTGLKGGMTSVTKMPTQTYKTLAEAKNPTKVINTKPIKSKIITSNPYQPPVNKGTIPGLKQKQPSFISKIKNRIKKITSNPYKPPSNRGTIPGIK